LNVDRLLGRLQRHYQAAKSFSASFEQIIARPGAPATQRTGIIYYEKPAKLRWEFDKPQPETIVSDGTILYDYDPGLNQVVETPLSQAFRSQVAAAFLLGAGNVRRDFKAAPVAASRRDRLARVLLTPKNGGERLEAGIDPQTGNIIKLAIEDPMGNKTEMSFSNIRFNQVFKDSQFQFTPPAGADIVSARSAQ